MLNSGTMLECVAFLSMNPVIKSDDYKNNIIGRLSGDNGSQHEWVIKFRHYK